MVNADNVSVLGEDCMRSLVTHFLLLTVIALLGLLCTPVFIHGRSHATSNSEYLWLRKKRTHSRKIGFDVG